MVTRTTLSLDDDVAARLARLRRERDSNLKDLVNDMLRRGMDSIEAPPKPRKPFRTKTYDMGVLDRRRLRALSRVEMGQSTGAVALPRRQHQLRAQAPDRRVPRSAPRHRAAPVPPRSTAPARAGLVSSSRRPRCATCSRSAGVSPARRRRPRSARIRVPLRPFGHHLHRWTRAAPTCRRCRQVADHLLEVLPLAAEARGGRHVDVDRKDLAAVGLLHGPRQCCTTGPTSVSVPTTATRAAMRARSRCAHHLVAHDVGLLASPWTPADRPAAPRPRSSSPTAAS
jgi:hypothetical protein